MQLELEEFLSTLFPSQLGELAGKKLFLRNRVPPGAKVFACYVYVSRGCSLRGVEGLLRELGIETSHVSVWKWFQQLSSRLWQKAFCRRRRRYLVVDETKIRTRKGWIYVFAALDPENREMVNFLITGERGLLDTLGFLSRCLRFCDGKPTLITDGGPWYRWPARRLGLKHEVVCGGVRSYVERWFETLKDRLRAFDCYFPTREFTSVRNFIIVFCFWYNSCRKHMSLDGPPTGGEGGFRRWLGALS